MKPATVSFTALLLTLPSLLLGQTENDPNEGLQITYDALSESFTLSWWGRSGYTYLLQESEDLINWIWAPVAAQPASNGVEQAGFETNALSKFYRLAFTNDPESPLLTADFDGDGISNGDEIAAAMDWLTAETIQDTDGDGLPDYWEQFYFGDQTRNGEADEDGDGIRDRFEWQARTHPLVDQTSSPTTLAQFSYNAQGNLLQVTGPVTFSFAFDAEGNLQSAN